MLRERRRPDERPVAFGHLLAIDGEVSVDGQLRGHLQAGGMEHDRPEKSVEVLNVLADEVENFLVRIVPMFESFRHGGRRRPGTSIRGSGDEVTETGDVADRGIKPVVEILAFLARNRKPKERRSLARYPMGVRAPLHEL